MALSFQQLWERMQDEDPGPLSDSGLESRSMGVIRKGNAFQSTGGKPGSFWENFLKVCNDSDGLADLLGIDPLKIQQWPAKIKDAMEKVRKADSAKDPKNNMLPTGDMDDIVQNPGDNPRSTGIPAQF